MLKVKASRMPTDVLLQSRESSLRLAMEGRRSLEEDLGDFLAGAGEVIGGTSREPDWDIALRLNEGVDAVAWVAKLCGFLRRWDVPRDAKLVVAPEGRRVAVFDGSA